MLTSLRICWVPRPGGFGAPCALPLFAIADTELRIEGKFTSLLKPNRLKMLVRLDDAGFPTAGGRAHGVGVEWEWRGLLP